MTDMRTAHKEYELIKRHHAVMTRQQWGHVVIFSEHMRIDICVSDGGNGYFVYIDETGNGDPDDYNMDETILGDVTVKTAGTVYISESDTEDDPAFTLDPGSYFVYCNEAGETLIQAYKTK